MGRKRKLSSPNQANSPSTKLATRKSNSVSMSNNVNDTTESWNGMHPLLNEVIVTNLFKYCPKEHLATCRLVCKTWRDMSLSTWRSSATINLISEKINGAYLGCGSETSLNEFLNCLDNHPSPHPFTNFSLEYWTFDPKRNLFEGGLLNRFWQLVGHHMKTLLVKNGKSSNSKDFLKVVNSLCPNLEKLTLMDCILSDRKKREAESDYQCPVQGEHPHLRSLVIVSTVPNEKDHPPLDAPILPSTHLGIRYLELFAHFPNLTLVTIETGQSHPMDILSLLKAVKRIRQEDDRKLANMKLTTCTPVKLSFETDPALSPPPVEEGEIQTSRMILELSKQLQIQLESVNLGDFQNEQDIKDVIKICGGRLTTLLACMDHSPLSNFPFGVELAKLENIRVSERFCHNLDFLRDTRNLRILVVWPKPRVDLEDVDGLKWGQKTVLVSNTCKSGMETVRLLNLANLDLRSIVSDEDLQCLAKWMPGVRELQMFLDDGQFPIVCQNWKHLTSLEVYGEQLTDEGIIGMKLVIRANRSGKTVALGICEEEDCRPNITFLKELQTFTSTYVNLSDASVWHGFLKIMGCFSHLAVSGKLISAKAKMALTKNIIHFDDLSEPASGESDY